MNISEFVASAKYINSLKKFVINDLQEQQSILHRILEELSVYREEEELSQLFRDDAEASGIAKYTTKNKNKINNCIKRINLIIEELKENG